MGKIVTPENPQPLTAHALLACLMPESFGGGQWARGWMDGDPGTEFWLRREGTQFVKLEANARYLPVTDAWIATTARGLGERLYVSPVVYRGYPATTGPTLDGQAVFTKFPIKVTPSGGFKRRDPIAANVAYLRALDVAPTIVVDQGDAIIAVHVLDEPVSVEWMAIAARGIGYATSAVPWELKQFTDGRVADPLANAVAAIKETMLVALPGQPHPALIPRFEIRAERIGGIVSWAKLRERYNLDAVADRLTERQARGRQQLARAMSGR